MRRVSPLSADQLAVLYESDALASPAQLFLRNQLHEELERGEADPTGRFYGVFQRSGLELVTFFGNTRVLVLGPGSTQAAVALRKVATGPERGFRIMIGPREPVAALLDTLRPKVQVELERSQPFLYVEDPERLGEGVACRRATAADLDWLAHSSLRLNEEDLHIPVHTVDRNLLHRRIEQRLDAGATWIVESSGRPVSKLEIGNSGPAGALIEGVFTEPDHRGSGLARRLVSAVSRDLLQRFPRVGLHVGRNNTPAIRAYLGAGFTEVEDLELALLGWR